MIFRQVVGDRTCTQAVVHDVLLGVMRRTLVAARWQPLADRPNAVFRLPGMPARQPALAAHNRTCLRRARGKPRPVCSRPR